MPTPSPESVSIPALLRAARGSYGFAISARLAEADCDDVPRNGAYLLGGMAALGEATAGLIRGLGVSKQAASQLIDTLVIRGYLQRDVNPDDRRRIDVRLTERGRTAAAAIGAAVGSVDDELAEMLAPGELDGLRAGLIALTEIRERMEDEAMA